MSRAPSDTSRFLKLILILLLCVLSQPILSALAEEPENIGEVVVEGKFENQNAIPDKPAASGMIIELDKTRDRYIELKDILASVPGIHTREFGGPGQPSTANIRGISAKGILIMIDGVPLNGLWSTGVDLSSLPLNGFDKIEILKGGESAFYGDSAMGGVINLLTSESKEKKNNLAFSLGSFGMFEAKSIMNFRGPDYGVLVALTGSSSRGDFPFFNYNGTSLDKSDDFNDIRVNHEIGSSGLLIKTTTDTNNGSRFSTVLETYHSRKGVPGLVTFPSPDARQIDTRIFVQTQMEKENIRKNLDGAFRMFFRRDGLDYEDKQGQATGSPIDTHRWDDLMGIASKFTHYDNNGNGLWSWQTELSNESFMQKTHDNRTRAKASVSIEREKYLRGGKVTLHSASRFDLVEGFEPQGSFKIGYLYKPGNSSEWRINLGNSFRAPGFDELYDNRGLVVGNPDLDSEKGIDVDLGWSHQTESGSVCITVFDNYLHNQVVYELTSGHRFKPFNVGKSEMRGIELDFTKNIKSISLSGNYTWLDARNRSDDPASKNKKLPSQPQHEFFGQVSKSFKPFDIELDYSYSSGNYITFANTTKLDSRSKLDARLKWKSGDWNITGEIRNLLDKNLTDVRGFPLPGRAYYVTFSLEF